MNALVSILNQSTDKDKTRNSYTMGYRFSEIILERSFPLYYKEPLGRAKALDVFISVNINKEIVLKKICLILCMLTASHMGWAGKKLTGGFGASTDYLWRGITFSNHKPIVKGGIDFAHRGLSLGAWVSTSQGYGSSKLTVRGENESPLKSDENGLENALYGKYSLSLANHWSAHLGAIYFYYPHNIAARYGRIYLGVKWKDTSGKNHVSLEAGTWDYAAESGPAESESIEYRLRATVGLFHFMAILEEDHFAVGSGYQYYQIRTLLGPPKSWDLPEDFCLGVTLGYANYENEENVSWTSYFHYILSLNREVDGFKTSLFYSDTNRDAVPQTNSLPGGTDRTVGLSFLKTF